MTDMQNANQVLDANQVQDNQNTSDVTNSGVGDWRNSLPDEFKTKYTEFKQPIDFIKGYDGLVKKLGKNPIVVPSETASEEEKQKFNMELRKISGVPEDESGYIYNVMEDLPEEIKVLISDDRISQYKKAALENGVTPKAFDAMMGLYQEQMMKDLQSLNDRGNQEYEATMANLKKEWGDNLDKKIKMANNFMTKHLKSEEVDTIKEKYGNDLFLVKTFANLAERAGEKMEDFGSNNNNNISFESLRERAKELTAKSVDAKLTIEERTKAFLEAKALNEQAFKMQGSRK